MLRRQLVGFALVGALQLAVDWLCFVALTWGGVDVVPANLAARISGAAFGFWLNAHTFAPQGEAPRRGSRQFGRFAFAWGVLTALSTLAVGLLDGGHGLQAAWVGKPLVDALLAAAGFALSRYWIYR